MITKEKFIDLLNRSLKVAKRMMLHEDTGRPSILISNVESLDFDITATISDWAALNGINFAVVDIANLTPNDTAAIPDILSKPTVLLLENFGDYSHSFEYDGLREHYRKLVKDCCYYYSGDSIFANTFLFAVATTTQDKPVCDLSETTCFCHLN